MSRQKTIRCVPLLFNGVDTAQSSIFIPFPVKRIRLRQISINTIENETGVEVGELRSNLINDFGSQTMCGVSLPNASSFMCPMDVEFQPCGPNINGDYSFDLVLDNGKLSTGIEAQVDIVLTLEFLGEDK